jgi:hypothetical protein
MGSPVIFRDTFARANVASLGSNWVQFGTLWTVSGFLATVAAAGAIATAKSNATADQSVQAIEQNAPGGGIGVGQWGVFARGASLGGAASYYEAYITATGTQVFIAKKISGGALTNIAGPFTVTRAAGSKLQLDLIGSTLQVWYGGVLLGTVIDTSLTGGGTQTTGIVCDSASAVFLSEFDLAGDQTWTFIPTGYETIEEDMTEVVDYDSGFVQRNIIWQRLKAHFQFKYDYITDVDKQTMQNFYRQARGQGITFLVADPRGLGVVQAAVPEVFAVADGSSTSYKVRPDKIATLSTFTDGVLDASQPTFSLMTGAIFYATPPYAGAVLSATYTGQFYRVYFEAKPRFIAYPPTYWKGDVHFVQEKLLEMGVPQ